MKNINYTKVKIIEEETPERAEYEINDFIEHCRKNSIHVFDITSHVNADAEGNYCSHSLLSIAKMIKQQQLFMGYFIWELKNYETY